MLYKLICILRRLILLVSSLGLNVRPTKDIQNKCKKFCLRLRLKWHYIIPTSDLGLFKWGLGGQGYGV